MFEFYSHQTIYLCMNLSIGLYELWSQDQNSGCLYIGE